jgi:YVTN family beta-propeller protein
MKKTAEVHRVGYTFLVIFLFCAFTLLPFHSLVASGYSLQGLSSPANAFVQDSTDSPPILPIIHKESNGSFSVDFEPYAAQNTWSDVEVWATSGGQLPDKMNGTFTAVANTIGGLELEDGVLCLPLNVAYGSSVTDCVWFTFDVEFLYGGYVRMLIWDVRGPGLFESDFHSQKIGIPYTVGHSYDFELVTSGTNTVTFSIKDTTAGISWSTSTWQFTVPSLTMMYSLSMFSPASAIEGYTTNSQLTNVPTFQTTVGYNIQTHEHSRFSSTLPLGIGTQVSGGPDNYSWSMMEPPLAVSVSPSSWTMDIGQTKLFNATASGGSGSYTSYQWYVNGSAQSGQTAATFSFTPTNLGSYSITATATDSTSLTSSQSAAAIVTVNSAFGPPTLTGTISVGAEPDGVAVTPDGAYVYVANRGSNSVSVIDTATHTVTANITVGTYPAGVAITPNGAYAYVTNSGSDSISVINTATKTVTANIPVGRSPFRLAIAPNGAYAYAANQGGNTVSVINTATNTVTANLTVGNYPFGIAVSPDGTRLYTTDYGDGKVSVVNIATNAMIASVTVGEAPTYVAISPNGAYAYVVNYASDMVSVINTATNLVTANIPVGRSPFTVTISPNGAFAYVTNGGNNSISVVNTATNMVTATVPLGGKPYCVAMTSDGAYAYITTWGVNSVTKVNNVALSLSVSSGTMYQGQTCNITSATITTGTAPYNYSWFVRPPGNSYSRFYGATLSSYVFETSTSTVTGNWSFIMQVTDSAGATLNSTAASVTVNQLVATPTPKPSSSGGGSSSSTTSASTSPTATLSPTPSPTPPSTTVSAMTDTGAAVELAISGNITSSQMSSIKITTNQSAASTTLAFSLTGQSGTTGCGNLTIPKSAVGYGTTPTIFIDGQPAPDQGYTQDANNYYVWYTTQFSNHQISIVFTSASFSSSPLPLEAICGIIVAAIVAPVAVVLVLRTRHQGEE